jgi:hypothetical protein
VSRADDSAHARAIADGVISVLSRLAVLPRPRTPEQERP